MSTLSPSLGLSLTRQNFEATTPKSRLPFVVDVADFGVEGSVIKTRSGHSVTQVRDSEVYAVAANGILYRVPTARPAFEVTSP